MGFSKKVADQALAACGRSCCICHVFCGTKMELHHIQPQSEGGNDDYENCIPLCFNCHADMGKPSHYKGHGYSATELKMHRDRWYARKAEALQTTECVCKADKQQFEAICAIFSQAEYILKEHHMAASFRQDEIKDLLRYADCSDDPFAMFIDADLEMLRSQLLTQLKTCVAIFRKNLFWNEGPFQDLCVSHMWLYNHRKLEDVTPDMLQEFEEEYLQLTNAASATWDAYVLFVQQIRFRIDGGI